MAYCPDALEIGTGDRVFSFQGYAWSEKGDPPSAPPPDAAVLAEKASAQLKPPDPLLHFGPKPDNVSVNYPVWLWIDDRGPLTASVSLRGVTVTATATISQVTWNMGEKGSGADPTVVCDGPGSSPTDDQIAELAKPACGYTYHLKSTKARTHGTSKWPVTATVDWTVNWTSNVGPSGTLALQTNGASALTVGEWRSVLVAGDSGN